MVTGIGCLLYDHCWYLTEVRNSIIKADAVLAGASNY
jgi:hypothetical protein